MKTEARRILVYGLALFALAGLVTTAPYVAVAHWAAKHDRVFAGVLFAYPDGLSYLAKIRQGMEGTWRFRLPYTADAEPTAYLFLFYVALGHLARSVGASPVTGIHLARLLGLAAMVAALGGWAWGFRRDLPTWKRLWIWLVFAVGMEGWLLPLGEVRPLPEAAPLLSAYVNAHFPWAVALTVVTLHPAWPERLSRALGRHALLLALLAAVLSLLAPFGAVVAATAWFFWGIKHLRRGPRGYGFSPATRGAWATALALILGAVPYGLYLAFCLRQDPYLAGWNAQNQTPLYPVEIMLALFAPWWWGLYVMVRYPARVPASLRHLAVAWLAAAWLWAVMPIPLQRRMLLAGLVPLVALSIAVWPAKRVGQIGWVLALVPTWAIYFLAPVARPGLFAQATLSHETAQVLAWMAEQVPARRVLTGPETGLFVPVYTSHRVFYAHPLESVPAEEERAWVVNMLCRWSWEKVVHEARRRKVDWLLWTPRETDLCPPPAWLTHLSVVYRVGSATLYALP